MRLMPLALLALILGIMVSAGCKSDEDSTEPVTVSGIGSGEKGTRADATGGPSSDQDAGEVEPAGTPEVEGEAEEAGATEKEAGKAPGAPGGKSPTDGLTEKQKTEMTSIYEGYQKKLMAIGTDKSLSDEQKAAKAKQLAEERERKLDSVVPRQERAKMGEQIRERGRQQFERMRAEYRDRMKKELGLSSEQVTKIEALFEKQRKGLEQAMKSGQKLTPDQWQKRGQENAKNFEAEMRKILSKEQYAKYEKMREADMKAMAEKMGKMGGMGMGMGKGPGGGGMGRGPGGPGMGGGVSGTPQDGG
ncbi:MAG TPA: hypothetical protein PLD23_01985 [Armatimonadota bacterium]|nr:hypothetical protein [Armatimonadota bacterium]